MFGASTAAASADSRFTTIVAAMFVLCRQAQQEGMLQQGSAGVVLFLGQLLLQQLYAQPHTSMVLCHTGQSLSPQPVCLQQCAIRFLQCSSTRH
jgi:hypothetical protein